MKNDKIAILVVGCQNSGKTTTMKYFEQIHDEKNRVIKQCKVGWRRIQLFLGKLDALSCIIYFIPSSPTEKNMSLENRLEKILPKDFLPEMFLIAEQLNGKEYNSTKDFLSKNGYEIIEFIIDSNKTGGLWEKWTDENKGNILKERAREIGDAFRKHVIEIIK